MVILFASVTPTTDGPYSVKMSPANADKKKTKTKKKKRLPKVTRVAEITPENEVPLVSDPRFAAQHWDPRFGRIPTKTSSVTATEDKRFEEALKSDKFKTGSSRVDRFGRPKRATVQDSDSELEEDAINVGLSSDSESESDIAPTDNEEYDEPAEKLGESTLRLAVTQLDWTTTRAVDIFVCFSSICPNEGALKRVTVYPSKLGLRRLAAEARLGPAFVSKVDQGMLERQRANGFNEDINEAEEESEDSDSDDDDAPVAGVRDKEREEWKAQKALRKYEEEKLNYFFAVAEFDNVNDANVIYDQCDGVEYGQSRCAFKLSFVPKDMELDRTPREVCENIPDGYAPPNAAPNTLSNSSVKMTWDADEPGRMVLKRRTMGKHEQDEDNLKAYLASASEEENEDDKEEIDRKRKLLLGGGDEDENDEEEMVEEMEVRFEPGMLEKGEEIVRQTEENKRRENETPWQARMRRMEERKIEKKQRRMDRLRGDEQEEVDQENVDEGPATFDDPFFKNANGGSDFRRAQKASKKRKRMANNEESVDDVEKQRQAAELELLLVDDRKKSGSEMKQVLAQIESDDDEDRTERKKKKRTRGRRRADIERKEKKLNAKSATPSALDTKDERFQGLFHNHLFAIDPTHPKYKKDETTERIVQEKQKRYRESESMAPVEKRTKPAVQPTKEDSSVMDLAAKIKSRGKKRTAR